MEKISIQIYQFFTEKIKNYHYWVEYKKLDAPIQQCNVICRESLGKVLVVAPHADDELIGCYGLYINGLVSNTLCVNMGYGKNEKSEIRKKEFVQFCKKHRQKYSLYDDSFDKVEELIKKMNPDTIALPCYLDWHDDHRTCNKVILQKCQELKIKPLILWYDVSVPIDDELSNFSTTFTKEEQKKKWRIFNEIYLSQSFMPVYRFILWERYHAIGTPFYAIEKYIVVTYDAARSLVKLFSDDKELIALKEELKSMVLLQKKIRCVTNKYKLKELISSDSLRFMQAR